MLEEYKKAVKAGLIGALFIVIARLATDAIFYWSLTRPSVQQFVLQQAGGSPYPPASFNGIPPDVLIAGLAVILGGLSAFAIYLLLGALAAYFAIPEVKAKGPSLGNVVVHNAFVGSIAGTIAQMASAPFTILFALVMDRYPPYGEPTIDLWPWLGGQVVTQFGVMLAAAIILAIAGALVCGLAIKASGSYDAAPEKSARMK